MSINTEQLAELLAGMARAQTAIIDAIESESGGWRNTHLLPKLNTASNMRLATPRLLDIPSRILLRSQGRIPMDVATIMRVLDEAGVRDAPAANATPTPSPAPAQAASAGAASATPASSAPADNDLGNFFDT